MRDYTKLLKAIVLIGLASLMSGCEPAYVPAYVIGRAFYGLADDPGPAVTPSPHLR